MGPREYRPFSAGRSLSALHRAAAPLQLFFSAFDPKFPAQPLRSRFSSNNCRKSAHLLPTWPIAQPLPLKSHNVRLRRRRARPHVRLSTSKFLPYHSTNRSPPCAVTSPPSRTTRRSTMSRKSSRPTTWRTKTPKMQPTATTRARATTPQPAPTATSSTRATRARPPTTARATRRHTATRRCPTSSG
jgi:hypothetical protein